MIRQAINCDICAAEKQTSNYWFVAYEQGGELKLRGWESPKNSRKGAKHLCGQKCAQRMMANFMASLMASVHSNDQEIEPAGEGAEFAAKSEEGEAVAHSIRLERPEHFDRASRLDRTDRSLVGRASIDSADLDAESWAGPVRAKEEAWETQAKRQPERENFLHAPRIKPSALNRLQRMV
ncbi:hypothetical protein [Granulicella sp. S190]|jgi:hypothetical protein|uniref:hypothetical protein n=1 Tax=Granulicella sp. S190 TaxID=1747226 RepID=UPI00131C774D|nr:hypothetical protein [Granulicella sp. S190]